jgi:arylsulfatase A-like enzyme
VEVVGGAGRGSGTLGPRMPALGLTLGVFAVLVLGCARQESSAPPLRLVDVARGSADRTMTIDGLQKRVLDPSRAEHVFPARLANGRRLLVFSIGLDQASAGSTGVRYEILVRDSGQNTRRLYERELHDPQWVTDRLELPGTLSEDADLVLRTTAPANEPQLADGSHAAWGDAVLMPPRGRPPRSLILISIDTLRADFVGCYRKNRARTPAFDAMARDGVLYETAYSPSTWTVPSHLALFYGLPAGALFPLRDDGGRSPDAEAVPLAEVLRRSGFLTAAFTGGGYLSPFWGFARGFDTYLSFQSPGALPGVCPMSRFDGAEVFGRATEWLQRHATAPFFLFIHTYDVHDRCPVYLGHAFQTGGWTGARESERNFAVEYYRTLVAQTDHRLQDLFGDIDRLGLADSTLVVFTSDHGELFWEHGVYGHGLGAKAYEPLVRVPLILRWPGKLSRGLRVPEPVGLTWVAPTILELLGVPVPPTMHEGLLPVVSGRNPPASQVFVDSDDMTMVRDGKWKLISSSTHRFEPEMYDLATDPTERENVARQEQNVAARILDQASRYAVANGGGAPGTPPAGEPASLDQATRARLRALGYVDGMPGVADD